VSLFEDIAAYPAVDPIAR